MNTSDYPYIGGNPLEERHSYTYVPYQGLAFLDKWHHARSTVKNQLDVRPLEAPLTPAITTAPDGSEIDTHLLLNWLFDEITDPPVGPDVNRWLRWLIQRFEVSKRLFPRYTNIDNRVKGHGGYRSYELYLRFAEALSRYLEVEKHLPSLNALLKCLDTLCSYHNEFDNLQKSWLARLIECESRFVSNVAANLGNEAPDLGINQECIQAARRSELMKDALAIEACKLHGTILVAADTMRSRGYAQALVSKGYQLDAVLLITAGNESRWGQTAEPPSPPVRSDMPGLFVPDLRIPLEETCARLSENVETFPTGTINSSEISLRLRELVPSLVIYSGFGGELVQSEILEASGPFLHMHAGWLPDYRGSTTVYYSLLERGGCGVSAIRLTSEIDAGEIFLRRWYAAPPPDVELDYYYDSIIRSDVLLSVLGYRIQMGRLPAGKPQTASEGEVYYIIHPVLKHLAILGLERIQY